MSGLSVQEPVRRAAGDNTLALFLGLYLLILAFFILLVSLSTIEERKARAVMDSLSATFAGIERPAGYTGGTSEGDRWLLTERELVAAFAPMIRVVEVDIVKPGREMRIGLPSAVVFATGAADPRASIYPTFDRVVAALSSPPAGVRVDAEFSMDRPKGTAERTLASSRLDALVREMIARGAPPARLSIALAAETSDRVWMTFRIHDDRRGGAKEQPL